MSLPEEAQGQEAMEHDAKEHDAPEQIAQPAAAEESADTEVQPEQGLLVEMAPDVALDETFSPEELLPEEYVVAGPIEDAELRAVLEAIIYVTDEPLTVDQICTAIEQPRDRVIDLLEQLAAEYEKPDRGLTIKEVAGGFKMTTKPEHHDAVRRFVKNLNPPLKLSLPALETLAVIAYKQPITAPEIMEIRGVQGAGVLKTLVDRKLIATAGRKQVVGKPILYKTTKEFLVQFGLRDLAELPTLKEFQELGRMDTETAPELTAVEQEEALPPIEPDSSASTGADAATESQPSAEVEPVAAIDSDGHPEAEPNGSEQPRE